MKRKKKEKHRCKLAKSGRVFRRWLDLQEELLSIRIISVVSTSYSVGERPWPDAQATVTSDDN